MRFRPVDYLVYLVVRAFICVLQTMRIETWHACARRLAWVLADVLRVRGRVVEENLRQAFPEASDARRREIARDMWEHLLLFIGEVAHAPRKIHETNWRDFVSLSGHDRLMRLLLQKRAALVVTGHFGNFELGGYLLALLGFPCDSVARTLDNPYLDRFVARFRSRTGQRLIAKKGGYDDMLDALDAGGNVAVLADQHAGQKGAWVEFFGREASTHKAIALLAMSHNATVPVCYTRRLDRPMHFLMRLEAVADPCGPDAHLAGVPELTQWFTRHIETIVRRVPGQYWWLHRRWKERHGRGKKAKAKLAA